MKLHINNYIIYVPENMAWAFSENEYYESHLTFWIEKIIKNYNRPVFYDIGSNIGYYSILFSATCKQVYSFEPTENAFSFLLKNIKQNKLNNITPIKTGILDKKGKGIINLYSSSGNNSIFERTIPSNINLHHIGKEEIELNTLDNLIFESKLLPPDIIKIDVEGAELHVLTGAKETIKQYQPIIFFEYADSTSTDAGYKKEDILDMLSQLNYNFWGISDTQNNNLVAFKDFSNKNISNIIAIPANKMEMDLKTIL